MESGRIRATFRVVTPLFSGGPVAGCPAITARALKGVIRFWWRALNYRRVCLESAGFSELQAEEARLFGAAATEGSQRGQSPLLWRIQIEKSAGKLNEQNEPFDFGLVNGCGGLAYLAGMGLTKIVKRHVLSTKPFYQSEFDLVLELTPRLRRSADGERKGLLDSGGIASIIDAIKIAGLMGGFGARSRRGLGSLSLLQIDGPNVDCSGPDNEDQYVVALKDLLNRSGAMDINALPSYSAFCSQTRMVIVERGPDPGAILESIGRKMQAHRGWGKNSQLTTGEPAEKKFKDDHDWAKEPVGNLNYHARRVAFGLPHSYNFFPRESNPRSVRGIVTDQYDRRASPLMIHVHRLSERQYIGVLTVMSADFLPLGEKLWIQRPGAGWTRPKHGERDERDLRPIMTIYGSSSVTKYTIMSELNDFIEGKRYDPVTKKYSDEYFPTDARREIWP